MKPRWLLVLSAFAASPLCAAENLDRFLEEQRARYNHPGLAAHVFRHETTLAEGAAGLRKSGAPERLTVRDKFHIGSNTKAMTATLAAMLVEQGRLAWSATLPQTFPELVPELHAAWGAATLESMLNHRSGAPANTNVAQTGTVGAQRIAYLKQIATRAPEHFPGSRHLYSNAGYIMAGAIIERASGRAWEALMREMLFLPLGMQSCGFGPPGRSDVVEHPWGHRRRGTGFDTFNTDNPAYLGPAGTVHCTLQDYARFALLHMGKDRLLRASSFAKLQTPPPGEEYALGWFAVQRGWANGVALSHAGSNTVNYFVAWLAPARGFGVIVAANIGGDDIAKEADAIVWALIQRFN